MIFAQIALAASILATAAQWAMPHQNSAPNATSGGLLNAYAALSTNHLFLDREVGSNALLPRQTSCEAGEKACDDVCIPTSFTCCAGGIGGCGPDYVCYDQGCCRLGNTCTGPPVQCQDGTYICGQECILDSESCPGGSPGGDSCDSGEESCGSVCMPAGSVCCPDALSHCNQGEVCVLNSSGLTFTCCQDGETCDGGDDSGGTGSGECSAGEESCGSLCMPTGSVCCSDGLYHCDQGEYCVSNPGGVTVACCQSGETCDDSGGGIGSDGCSAGEESCGSLCMPLGHVCCSDGLHHCDAGEYCVLDVNSVAVGCCANGETCSGGAGGGAATSASLTTLTPTYTTDSSYSDRPTTATSTSPRTSNGTPVSVTKTGTAGTPTTFGNNASPATAGSVTGSSDSAGTRRMWSGLFGWCFCLLPRSQRSFDRRSGWS